MIISKARSSVSAERSQHQSSICNSGRRKHSSAVLDLQNFIEARDYTGAITLLQLKHLVQTALCNMEDQLSLASFHYLQANYQDATDIYKRVLLEHRDWLALNVFVALCYYNLDFHDVSLEILNAYLQAYPDSAMAANLKACNNHKLWGGKIAVTDLRLEKEPTKGPVENELLEHNLVVFRHGEGALQVLPRLQDIFPEAQLNLAIYHLHNSGSI
ncbi:hypothetical protein L7F22_056730 [Adiantum nelumboides]|nr:hypothetical protein [Adiantum nelumboides]